MDAEAEQLGADAVVGVDVDYEFIQMRQGGSVLMVSTLGQQLNCSDQAHGGEPRRDVQEVASGELDAFQDVWLPNQEALLDQAAEDVELLDPWFLGETKQGMAVPAYMDVRSID